MIVKMLPAQIFFLNKQKCLNKDGAFWSATFVETSRVFAVFTRLIQRLGMASGDSDIIGMTIGTVTL